MRKKEEIRKQLEEFLYFSKNTIPIDKAIKRAQRIIKIKKKGLFYPRYLFIHVQYFTKFVHLKE